MLPRMRILNEDELAYRGLKPEIDQQYPQGWYVGVADGRVVAASEDFRDLVKTLKAEGRDPRQVLVVEAGVTYPDYVTIFMGSERVASLAYCS
jgi:hypothetical protein